MSELETKIRAFPGQCGPGEVWVLANTKKGGGWERVASCNSVKLALLTRTAFVHLKQEESKEHEQG